MPDERLSRFRQFPDRRLDGADLVKWLSAEVLGVDGGILGWWLCYDADDALPSRIMRSFPFLWSVLSTAWRLPHGEIQSSKPAASEAVAQ